jgi:hypothetical protein
MPRESMLPKIGAVLLSIQLVDESHQIDVWLPHANFPIPTISTVGKLLVLLPP